jgi:PAS domain S-box-containing protein
MTHNRMPGLFEIDIQSIYVLISFFAAAISMALILFLMPRWRVAGVQALLLLMGSVAIWAFCYGMELKVADLDAKLRWVSAEYLGVAWIGLLFFRFSMVLSARSGWLSGFKGWSLLTIPVLTILGILTNDHHHLMWSRAWIESIGPISTMAYDRGWGFWVFVGFSYTLLLAATMVLFHAFLASGRLERKNFIVLMVGLVISWASNFFYLTGFVPFRYLDLTPLAFAISGCALFWGILRHQILELVPIARDAVIESMQDAVFVLNLQDQVIDLNSAAGHLIPGDRPAIVGRLLEDLFPPLFKCLEKCRHTGIDAEEITTTIDTVTRLWRMRYNMLSSNDRNPCGWLITLQDITEQRRNEIALRESEQKIRSITANALDGIIMIDPAGRVSFWNRAAEELFGYQEDEIVGKDLHTHLAPPLFHDRYHQAFSEFQRSGNGQMLGKTIEIQCLRKNGELFPAELSLSPLQINGQWHAVGVVRDISERKKTQEYLIQSEKMLSVGGLAAGMAHEINNHLAGILSSVQMIRMRLLSDLPANQREADACGLDLKRLWHYLGKRGIIDLIEATEQSCQRAAAIVRNMLTFSRKSDTVFSNHDLNQLLEQTIDLANNDFDLKKHHDFRRIEIVRDAVPDMPAIPCDGSQIQQVLLNILKNGAYAMWKDAHRGQTPRFILRVYVEPDYGCIDIRDNGPGISEEIQKRIFEPFYTTKPTGSGTGLGLSIAYFIITEKHGGILSVSSTPGEGTTFTIKLPLRQTP